jgi:hypothetical protein
MGLTNAIGSVAGMIKQGITAKAEKNTPEEQSALNLAKQWLEDDKAAKQDFNAEMKEMHKAYMGDHWSLKGPNGKELRKPETMAMKPNSVDNIVFSIIEGFVSEFSNVPELISRETEPNDELNAKALTELDNFVMTKNKFIDEQQKLLRYFFKYGIICAQDFWDQTWEGGRGPNRWIGDIRIKALHPDVLYIDARCKSDINTARRVHKVIRYPLEHFIETFPGKGELVEEDTSSYFPTTGDGDENSKARNKTAWQIETWYVGKPLVPDPEGKTDFGLHVLTWAGDVVLKHQSYIYPEPKYPFIFRSLYDREGTIWGFGEIKQIVSPQIIMNKEDELILESNLHQSFGQTFFTKAAIDQKQKNHIMKNGSLPNTWFEVNQVDGIKRLFGQGAASSLFTHREAKQHAMEAITGRFDVTQGKVPSGITAASAIIELNARASNRMKSKEQILRSFYQEVGERTNNYISWYYDEKRGYRILGPDNKPQFKDFSNQQIKKVYIFSDSKVVPFNQFQPQEGMVEGEHYEVYSPEFDVEVKADVELPSGRAYFIELAKELYKDGVIDKEGVLYAIENGKLEPAQIILDRMEMAKQQAMAAAAVPPMGGGGGIA